MSLALRAEAELELRRRGDSFYSFIGRHNPTLLDYEHIPLVVDVAQRVVDGLLGRVLILEPPRYFKSEVFSRLLPAYYLRKFPKNSVGLASYGAELAWALSDEARNYYQQDGGDLRREAYAKKHWRTLSGGEMWAAGVGGPILGFGYNVGIIDDPTDPEKAHSPTYQKRFENWFPAKWRSRQEPGAAIVLVMQRLGMEDPIDFLFRREVGEDTDCAPEHWHVVLLDEIRSDEPLGRWDGPMGLPSTCTLETDDREIGEALAPTRFSLPEVRMLQVAAGSYVSAAQRQQRPTMPAGDFWRLDWFETYKELPRDAYNGGKDWDTAYTRDEANSASAYIESYRGAGKDGKFRIYIHDVDWRWVEFPELVAWMWAQPGPHYVEQKATGKSAVQALRREHLAVSEVEVTGDKFARAAGVQPVISNKRVYIREEIAEKLLKGDRQGLLRVTAERLQGDEGGLDVNDAFVQAIMRHTSGRKGFAFG